MTKPLPTYTALGEPPAPRPAPPPGQVDSRGLDAQLLEDKALISAGAHLVRGSGELFAAQDRLDTTVAEDAFNKLRNSQVDLTTGEDGFQTKKGGDAVNGKLLEDYSGRFQQSQKTIADGLANDNQKAKFNARAAIAGVQFKQDILKHVYTEDQVYGKQVLEGTVLTETRNAQVNWDDPYAVQTSRDRIDMAIDNQVKKNGIPAEEAAAMRQKAFTGLTESVISSAVANGDSEYAQEYYDAHKDEVDKPTQAALLKTIKDGKQREIVNDYTTQFLGVRDDLKGLDQLYVDVGKNKNLDEDRKNALMLRIATRSDTVERRNQILQDQQLKAVQRGIDAVNANTLAGMPPSDEQIQPVVAAAQGTDLEQAARQMVGLAQATRQFRVLPPAAQEQFLNQAEANIRADPTKGDRTVLTHLRSIYDGQQRQIQDDPVSFAERQGFAEPSKLDLTQPATQGPALQERAALARTISAQYQAPLRLLTKEEKDLLSGTLKGMNVQAKRDYFGALSTAMGSDTEAYSAIMAQLAPDDPVTAIAGVYAGKGVQDDKGNQVADLILRGEAVLRPNRKEDGSPDKGKLWPMPTAQDEATMRRLFSDYERDAFAGHPQARSDHYQAAVAIYAAKSTEAGDASGVLDSDRWRESMRLATGGIDRYNGRSVVLPWGMTYGNFKDGVRDRIDAMEQQGQLPEGLTASRLRDMPMESIGDGRYIFRAGDGVLVKKDQGALVPVIIDFNKPAGVNPVAKTQISQDQLERAVRTADVTRPANVSPFRRPEIQQP